MSHKCRVTATIAVANKVLTDLFLSEKPPFVSILAELAVKDGIAVELNALVVWAARQLKMGTSADISDPQSPVSHAAALRPLLLCSLAERLLAHLVSNCPGGVTVLAFQAMDPLLATFPALKATYSALRLKLLSRQEQEGLSVCFQFRDWFQDEFAHYCERRRFAGFLIESGEWFPDGSNAGTLCLSLNAHLLLGLKAPVAWVGGAEMVGPDLYAFKARPWFFF